MRGRGHEMSRSTADDELTYLREFEHGTLARLLLAEGVRDRDDDTIDAAIGLAERLLTSALDGGRQGSALDVLVVLALGRHARGEIAGAAADLDRAVALAEPDRWVRVFLDEGAPMMALLSAVSGRAGSSAFLSELRAAAGSASGRDAPRQTLSRTIESARAGSPAPPSERPGRSRLGPRTAHLAQHPSDSHEEHLHEARREHAPIRDPAG